MADLTPTTVPTPQAQAAMAAAESLPAATAPQLSEIRRFLQGRGSGRTADASFNVVMIVCALSVLLIVLLIVFVLTTNSRQSMHAFGWRFFGTSNWDPVNGQFGALPFIYGTLVSSLLATAIAVPLSIAVAIFGREICPIPRGQQIPF